MSEFVQRIFKYVEEYALDQSEGPRYWAIGILKFIGEEGLVNYNLVEDT